MYRKICNINLFLILIGGSRKSLVLKNNNFEPLKTIFNNMKKTLIILALLPLLFVGCSKSESNDPKPEEKLFKVNFSAKIMDIDLSPIGPKSSTSRSANTNELIKESINIIEFFIYDSGNNLVGYQNSDLFDVYGLLQENALKFNLDLPKGEYKVAVIGKSYSATTINKDLGYNSISIWYEQSKIAEREIVKFTPIYAYKPASFSVSGVEMNNQLILKRLNSEVELIIKDEMPENAKYIFFGGTSSRYVSPFGAINNLAGKSFIEFDLDTIRNKTDKILNATIIPEYFSTTEAPKLKSYDILIYDKDYKYLGIKTINDVYFKENFKTKLVGSFFDTIEGNINPNSLSIEFDHSFSGEIVKDISK